MKSDKNNVLVSLSINLFEPLSYNYPGDPSGVYPGLRVAVPVGNRLTTGWVVDTQSQYEGKTKDIIAAVRDVYLPGEAYLSFGRAVSFLYLTSLGSLLDSHLPPSQKSLNTLYFFPHGSEEKAEKLSKYSLPELRKMMKDNVIDCFYKKSGQPRFPPQPAPAPTTAASPSKDQFILSYHREAGFRETIDACLQKGQRVLLAVPDNLTAAYFKELLGDVDVYNSNVKPKEREILWNKYANGDEPAVLVGGMSAVLLPVKNLGAVICARAGSPAYKRAFFSKYNTHTLARLKAETAGVPLVEGFSTYTVDAFRNRSELTLRENRDPIVPVEVHRIKPKEKGIPENFLELVNHYYGEKKKVLVVLNRKESTTFLFCSKCKNVLRCSSCGGFLEVAEDTSTTCARCGLEKREMTHCYRCESELTIVESVSTASVKKQLKQRVSAEGLMTLASEGLKEDHMYNMLKRIEAARVVISTQVILNPFFRGIFDAVIYIRPESNFNIDAYDAAGQIFSMAAELRELVKSGGSVDIFSSFAFHYSLKLMNEEEMFFDREMKYREWFELPPFCNLYRIEVKNRDLRKLAREMRRIHGNFKAPLNIKRTYLMGRKPYRGVYKGILEAHTQPRHIIDAGLLGKKDISIELVVV